MSFDHHPRLRADKGTREPANARMAHVLCNRADQGWRMRIRPMLNGGMSLKAIAEKLKPRPVKRRRS